MTTVTLAFLKSQTSLLKFG